MISLTLTLTVFFFYEIFKKDEDKDIIKTETTNKVSDKNLIEEIQYFSKDVNGNTYLIQSKTGKIDEENPDIIYLIDVEAKINFDENEKIRIFSDEAIYNINNFDTEFIDNVKLLYEDNNLSCKNILVKF